MPSKKPQMTIRVEEDEYQYLEEWASEEFLSPTQLAKIIIKRAIANRKKEKRANQGETQQGN